MEKDMQPLNWHPLIRVLHWLTVLIMVLAIGAVWSHEVFEKSNPLRAQLMQLHFMLGGSIGLLALTRLLTRTMVKSPVHAMPPLVALLAKGGHLGLYALMLMLPLFGYAAVSGKGVPINLFGLMSLPPLPVSKDLANACKEVHEALGNTLLVLVGLHVCATVFHAVVLKDKVLQSMAGRA